MRNVHLQARISLLLCLLTWSALVLSTASPSPSSPPSVSTASTPAPVCLSKTVNYITHTLPQQCRKATGTPVSSRTEAETTTSADHASSPTAAGAASETPSTTTPAPRSERDGAVLSFEEWKELMLRKRGQDPSDIHTRQPPEGGRRRTGSAADSGLDSLGEEGEISLDFDVLYDIPEDSTDERQQQQQQQQQQQTQDATGKEVLYDDGKTQYYRSKDAGKTCKERFSYSSFDAGATVLKTSPGAKNPKAILLENKDSYMLFACTAEDKHVIVELSDDILVDTVVLANYEFFSSMVRHFRVSVSDRYPAKADRWKVLGTFEAVNSRDIQPFLVENPQIWAKYVRIDFLTHYGTEYYCPVSLLRVHGTRMLESWKEAEYEEAAEESDAEVLEVEEAAEIVVEDLSETSPTVPEDYYIFVACNATCPLSPLVTLEAGIIERDESLRNRAARREHRRGEEQAAPQKDSDQQSAPAATRTEPPPAVSSAATAAATSVSSVGDTVDHGNASSVSAAASTAPPANHTAGNNSSSPQAKQSEPPSAPPPPPPQKSKADTPSQQAKNNKTAAVANPSASPSPPTVQESFFKTVAKRLQLLESNVTWSLKYVEDQSRNLQDALLQIESSRLVPAEALLTSLNATVREELAALGRQYDQVWQSTVIALETQREQAQAEILALSARLNVLADEVVFQKRMAIAQSVLLLSCLALVIFSRSLAGGAPPQPPVAAFHRGQYQQQQHMLLRSLPPTPSPEDLDGDVGTSTAVDSFPYNHLTPTTSALEVDSAVSHENNWAHNSDPPTPSEQTAPSHATSYRPYSPPNSPELQEHGDHLDPDGLVIHETRPPKPQTVTSKGTAGRSKKPLPPLPE